MNNNLYTLTDIDKHDESEQDKVFVPIHIMATNLIHAFLKLLLLY